VFAQCGRGGAFYNGPGRVPNEGKGETFAVCAATAPTKGGVKVLGTVAMLIRSVLKA